MKILLTYIFTLLIFTACQQKYKIENNFKPDNKYLIAVKRANVDSRDLTTKDIAQLTYIDASFSQVKNKLKCVWKYDESKFVGPENLISQIGKEDIEMSNLYKNFEIEILFDPYNEGYKILNYEQLRENIKSVILKIYKNPTTKIDSATMIAINELIEPTYSTPAILFATYFPEVDLFFNLYAKELTKGLDVKSEYFYPNPFGEEPFPVIRTISIDSKKDNILIINDKEITNKKETNRILKKAVGKISQSGNASISEEEIPNFSLKVNTDYYYDLETKLIIKAVQRKIVKTSNVTTTKILEVKLINNNG